MPIMPSVPSQEDLVIEQPKGLMNLEVAEKSPTNKNMRGSKIYKHPPKAIWVPNEGVLGAGSKTIKIMLPKMNSTFRNVDKKGSLMMISED
jgi:hypothetical protein